MKVAEYKQIDTEIETNTIMVDDYDEQGNVIGQHEETVTKEIPIMGMVYREMLDEEIAEMQKMELEQAMEYHPTTIEEKLQMLAETITEELPQGTIQGRDTNGSVVLPFKVGYRWEKKLVGTTIMYESVRDENAIGTQSNPIIYTDESPLIDNAWYKKDGKLKVYMMGEFEEM